MRIAPVALVLAVGCGSRSGAYLAIEGGKAGVTFDHVELYFGGGGASVIPRTPATVADPMPPPPGKRFTRQFSDTDRHDLGASAKRLDYYLPSEATEATGKYVAVVAYAGQTPVGIGELFDYTVPTDTLYEFTIDLAPYDPSQVELWGEGSAPGCLRYTHARTNHPATVAVVRGNDIDCDAVVGHLDCEDLAFCRAGDPCNTDTNAGACVVQENGDCITGTCINGQGCVGSTCEIPGVCADSCLGMTTLDAQLTCGLMQGLSHEDLAVPCIVDGIVHPLCDPFVVVVPPPPENGNAVACTDPQIEAPAGGISDGYQFAVTSDAAGGNCIITLTSLDQGIGFDHTPDHHLLISVAASTLNPPTVPRWTFVLGFVGEVTGQMLCDVNASPIGTGSGSTMSCAH